jgi:hypothetical protein
MYLDILLKYGSESAHYYKQHMKKSNKLFIYQINSDIKAIVGLSDTIAIVKSVHRPSWCICRIQFLWCCDDVLFHTILRDIDTYAANHGQSQIYISHVITYPSILTENGYYRMEYDSCTYCQQIGMTRIYHDYMKDVTANDTIRIVYNKKRII